MHLPMTQFVRDGEPPFAQLRNRSVVEDEAVMSDERSVKKLIHALGLHCDSALHANPVRC